MTSEEVNIVTANGDKEPQAEAPSQENNVTSSTPKNFKRRSGGGKNFVHGPRRRQNYGTVSRFEGYSPMFLLRQMYRGRPRTNVSKRQNGMVTASVDLDGRMFTAQGFDPSHARQLCAVDALRGAFGVEALGLYLFWSSNLNQKPRERRNVDKDGTEVNGVGDHAQHEGKSEALETVLRNQYTLHALTQQLLTLEESQHASLADMYGAHVPNPNTKPRKHRQSENSNRNHSISQNEDASVKQSKRKSIQPTKPRFKKVPVNELISKYDSTETHDKDFDPDSVWESYNQLNGLKDECEWQSGVQTTVYLSVTRKGKEYVGSGSNRKLAKLDAINLMLKDIPKDELKPTKAEQNGEVADAK